MSNTVQTSGNSIQFEIKTSEIIDEKQQNTPKNQSTQDKETTKETEKEKINIINSSKNQKIVFSVNPKDKLAESGKPSSLLFVCLLCKRKFENEEKLRKHESFSDLHKVCFFKKKNSDF